MTKRLALLASIVWVAACASRAATSPPPPTPGQAAGARQVELSLDREVEADGLRLTWTSLNDSRCARGVTCVWAGEVTVELSLRGDGDVRTLTLTAGPRPGAGAVETANHELRLLDVTPYPTLGVAVQRGVQRALLEIRRK